MKFLRIITGIVFLIIAVFLALFDIVSIAFVNGTPYNKFDDGRLLIIASYVILLVSAFLSLVSFRGVVKPKIKKLFLKIIVFLILIIVGIFAYYIFHDFEKLRWKNKELYTLITLGLAIVCISCFASVATLKTDEK
jgi:high-affinity Fe2+/Pb2+ permease